MKFHYLNYFNSKITKFLVLFLPKFTAGKGRVNNQRTKIWVICLKKRKKNTKNLNSKSEISLWMASPKYSSSELHTRPRSS